MKQIATVARVIDDVTAEVTVVRQSACAHDCADCAGCGSKPSAITVQARCPFPVSVGDKVELFSDNRVLGYAALVYLVPLVLFLAGYILPPELSQPLRFLCGSVGFLAGVLLAVLCDRIVKRRNAVTYQILRKI